MLMQLLLLHSCVISRNTWWSLNSKTASHTRAGARSWIWVYEKFSFESTSEPSYLRRSVDRFWQQIPCLWGCQL